METPDITPFLIFTVNTILVLMIFWLSFYNWKKIYNKSTEEVDYTYHLMMSYTSTVFAIANICAFVTNYYIYFVLKLNIPEAVSWIRYVDRFCMLLCGGCLIILSKKWFLNK